jgi:hypothetical protein
MPSGPNVKQYNTQEAIRPTVNIMPKDRPVQKGHSTVRTTLIKKQKLKTNKKLEPSLQLQDKIRSYTFYNVA